MNAEQIEKSFQARTIAAWLDRSGRVHAGEVVTCLVNDVERLIEKCDRLEAELKELRMKEAK